MTYNPKLNEAVINQMQFGMEKEAASTFTEYVRMKARETGFHKLILPFQPATDADLTQVVDTDKPVIIFPLEPDSPGSVSVPFNALPNTWYLKGRKARMMFQVIETQRYQKNVEELRTYKEDIRQILSDNALKDLEAEEDGRLIETADMLMVGPEMPALVTGQAQWKTLPGGLTRINWAEGLKIMRRSKAKFSASVALMNHISILDFLKWGRNEVGGDLAQQIAQKGFGETEWFGLKLLVTIKDNLVPDGAVYYFAASDKLGKAGVLTDTTAYVNTKAYMVEWFYYKTIASTIANISCVARADFGAYQS